MCIKYFAFALLWFPGVLHAQSTTQGCDAPTLDGGFFAPKQETYSHGTKLSYTCNEGRQLAMKGWWATSTCHNGRWSHQPQCIESMNACSVPPKIPHAVIVHQDYQEVFAAGSEVQYECEDGYTAEGAHNKKSVCTQGSWTQGPTCTSSSTSDSNNRDSRPMLMNVRSCGARPNIENAVIVEEGPMYLKYQCKSYYRLVGPDTVSCYSDGSWSELPTCEEAYCVMDPARSAGYGLVVTQSEYIKEGEAKGFHCTTRGYYAFVRCTNRKIVLTRCCSDHGHRYYDDCRVRYQSN
ncbi:complement factor H-like isoform X1 [Oreochromis niloticus]|uniref:complement factor H-like isoform X1 n=1 Tax=Oreochromis niloticus TaxID=8128 RepID=UPI000905CCEB|nr:complement factor H-like isoform X1 [Oreochromis niloticus]